MRIALVTGASSGIGREFVRQIDRLYQKLDEIWVVARRTDLLKELQKQIGTPVRIYDGDLSRDYIFEKIQKDLERYSADIRMLVLSAGYGKMGRFEEIPVSEQAGMIDLNCRALTRMTGICMPFVSAGSRILMVSSAAAFAPQPGFAVYAATKSYVYSLAWGLNAELRSKGVYVTAVCPGPVDTEFFERSGQLPRESKLAARMPAERVVRQALKDAVRRKGVSVCGGTMRTAWAAAKLLPYGVTSAFMKRFNHIV